jgi:hypothetical protein
VAEAVSYMKKQHRGWTAVFALAAPLLTVVACGTTPTASRTGAALASCPAKSPPLTLPRLGARTPSLPVGAIAATICQYAAPLAGGKAASAPLRRLGLLGAAADGLSAVLNGAGPMTSQALRCDGAATLLPFEQVIYFGYRDGRYARVVVTFTNCQLAVVTAASGSGVLTSPIQDDLFGYTLVTAHDRGQRVPDVIGLAVRRAISVAQRQHFTLTVDGEAVDPAVPAGTVIFQVLPAAVPDPGPSPYSLSTVVAVHSAPECRASELRLSYRAGGAGAGSDFGEILLRDVTSAPCHVGGRLQITGVNANGRPATNTVTATIAAPGVLTPDTPAVHDLAPVPPGVLAWLLQAAYRDDGTSPNGLCAAHYVIPARWRVRLPDGSVVLVPNADSGSQLRLVSSHAGLVTCRGRLGAKGQATLGG